MEVALEDVTFDVVRVHGAAVGAEGPGDDLGEHGGRADFVIEDVGLFFDEDGVAGAGVDGERDLVAHGAAGHEEGGLFARFGRAEVLKLGDGGVIAEDVVAESGEAHGFVHFGAGSGDGIAAEIDGHASMMHEIG